MNVDDNTPQRILIDTDPGIDDSMAILFAFNSPEVKVEGLTTVFGNGGTETTTANALRLVELAERTDVPVARGAETPLVRPYTGEGWRVHGRNGLGEVELPAPRSRPDSRRAAQFIVDTVMANPGQFTLVPLGPLTNVALAVSLEPRIAERVKEVVLMGGAANAQGNASAVAEANIRNDPEAAHIVFNAPWRVTMVGLDVTRKVIMTPAYIEALTAAGNPFVEFIGKIARHYLGFYRTTVGIDGFHVHDSSAVAYVLDPTLFETAFLPVDVEIHSANNFGQTSADWRKGSDREPNVNVCTNVDSERLLNLYQRRLTEASL
jgi:uridine nucleosidase